MPEADRILLVEDDRDLSDIANIHLTNAGYTADAAYSLADALRLFEERSYDLVLLDIMLPDGKGSEFCQTIRAQSGCPIIFISCIDDGDSIVSALHSGGDDYMTKPVNWKELLARVEANIRRATVYADGESPASDANLLRFGSFSVDRRRRRVRRGDETIDLTPIEYAILEYFCANSGELILYNDLYRSIWGVDGFDDLRTLAVHVSNLRKKIDPDHIGLIETVRNAGYIFCDVRAPERNRSAGAC
ncbi:MAG: response regulator transcription factor [Clostridiales Family XIII bacterium]|jgi:DNA-binding response OmpR family regulator|nr:response regulator transcription factor [Clostridiales Family XIII bacterium]